MRDEKKPKSRRIAAKDFPVVAIGASAGGLEAFLKLVAKIPVDSGMAFVLIQHLDPSHESLGVDIINKATKLRTVEASDGVIIRPNTIYLKPPQCGLHIIGEKLKTSPRTTPPHRHTIDYFFESLAKSMKSRAIGIVLSGMGNDGTHGLKLIRAEGGATIVQDPASAKFESMPTSAIEAGMADFVLDPGKMPQELMRLVSHPHFPITKLEESTPEDTMAITGLSEIFGKIQAASHVDFSQYKVATIQRRIHRRMIVQKTKDFNSYNKFLQAHPEEVKTLYDDILINVTEFFRDPAAFEALKTHVFPELVNPETLHAPLRIWVAGCSTGEEVYSLAISLIEWLESKNSYAQIQIFATDISERAIQVARTGTYSKIIEKNVSQGRLEKYFEKQNDVYKVNKSIRDLCLFSKHDMTSDPPFARLDLVTCRNVLIYFSLPLQKRVMPIFHYALKPDGFLWLGKSETHGNFSNLFEVENKTHKIYRKKNVPSRIKFNFPAKSIPPAPAQTVASNKSTTQRGLDFQRDADKIVLSRFSSPSVIINSELEILQFRGRCTPYLEQVTGQPSTNLLKMARPELQAGLRLLIKSVQKENKPSQRDGLNFTVDGKQYQLSIEMLPTNPQAHPKDRTYLVIFNSKAQTEKQLAGKSPAKESKQQIIYQREIESLARELAEAKESQQSLIQEYDASQEELTSANEELQSTNEELQSTNEELETAKEELQSTNEELTTVNEELQIRNSDLTILGSDLSNLLSSTEIPILMVANDGKIRRFTSEAREAFNLISTDIGRSISDIKSNFGLDLVELISEVAETLLAKRIEVQDKTGAWRQLQIRPYKTLENKIDGVSIALLDIDQIKQKEENSKQSLDYIKSIADSVPLPFAVIGSDLLLKSANDSFYRYFHIATNATGKDLFSLVDFPENYRQNLKSLVTKNINHNIPFTDFELNYKFAPVGMRKLLLSGGKVRWIGDEPEAVLISFMDITERSRLENELTRLLVREREARSEAEKANRSKDVFLATLSHELRTPLSAILTWSQLIGSNRIDASTTKQGAAVIEQSAKAQSQLIDDLLDISRIISGKLALSIKSVCPVAVIRAAVESVRPLFEKKGLTLEMSMQPTKERILADPIRLQQIIWNLLTNAIKFSPKDGKIEVQLSYEKENLRQLAKIKVIDHGKGIPPEFLAHVFNRFSQADSASTRVHGGLGLGLSIVRNLVELQGGSVKAENAQVGTGAILSVCFPVIPAEADIIQPPDPASIDAQDGECTLPCLDGVKVLFVEDNDNTRESLVIYLKSFGAVVKAVDSVKAALKAFPDFRPDVLISDIAMPNEDGYSLIRKIRKLSIEKGGNVPAIALTAYASAEDADYALSEGFHAHVAKPVEAAILARVVIQTHKDVLASNYPILNMIERGEKK